MSLWKARLVRVTRSSWSRDGLDDLGMAVALVDRRVGGQEIEVASLPSGILDLARPSALEMTTGRGW
ncbi:MAG: hypothetical protein MZV70_06055 [Desulfobacterales bacterium]|nr:hypothetical protein [Desulfobacterales bacterium]